MTKAGKIIALTSIILCAVSFINKGLKYSNIPQFIFEYEKTITAELLFQITQEKILMLLFPILSASYPLRK